MARAAHDALRERGCAECGDTPAHGAGRWDKGRRVVRRTWIRGCPRHTAEVTVIVRDGRDMTVMLRAHRSREGADFARDVMARMLEETLWNPGPREE